MLGELPRDVSQLERLKEAIYIVGVTLDVIVFLREVPCLFSHGCCGGGIGGHCLKGVGKGGRIVWGDVKAAACLFDVDLPGDGPRA